MYIKKFIRPFRQNSGFTLIEIMVVLAILGILFTFIAVALNAPRQLERAKDIKRQEDLSQIRNALNAYYYDHSCYPVSIPFGEEWKKEGGRSIYMKKVPQDEQCQSNPDKCYIYKTDETTSCPSFGIVFTKLSNPPEDSSTICPLNREENCTPQNFDSSWACKISGDVPCSYIADSFDFNPPSSDPTSIPPPVLTETPSSPTEPPVQTSSFEVGLEAGAQSDTSMVNLVEDSGAKWVRLNFIIRCGGNENISYPACSWSNSQSDINTYNQIINAYLEKGIKIYGLIGAESVKGPPNQSAYDRDHPNQFTNKFIDTADVIVSTFGDRVKVFEIFNEPNDWAGGSDAQMPTDYFAEILAEVYEKIKIDRGRSDISLISGPLVSLDHNSGADYLSQTYQEGLNSGSWTTIKNTAGSYPLDGIGYHIYVAQGADDQASVEPNLNENLNAIKAVISLRDPGKKIWISEFGWGTRGGSVSEAIQAQNLTNAYALFKNISDVRMAMWFTIQDFGDPAEFGLLHGDQAPKQAWSSFQAVAEGN